MEIEFNTEPRKSDNLNLDETSSNPTSKPRTPKFKVGQYVKSELTESQGIIIKVLPNAAWGHSDDLYILKTSDGTRTSIAGNLLKVDESVVTMQVDGIDTDVVVGQALKPEDLEPLYKEGDYAIDSISQERVRILKISSQKSFIGDTMYDTVNDSGETFQIAETMLMPYIEEQYRKKQMIEVEYAESDAKDMKHEVELITEKIIKFLNIKESQNPFTQLENAMKIHKYIAQNSTYTSDIMDEKQNYRDEDVYLNELYNGLVNKRGVCTTDAIVFKHLLETIGMEGKVVILKSKNGGVHAATLVSLLDGEYYYFDATTERSTFNMFSNDPEKFVFCLAGLGQKEYSEYYTPVGILPENLGENILPMPSNISQGSVPKGIIASIGNGIQNLPFEENGLDEQLSSIEVPINEKDQVKDELFARIRHVRDDQNKNEGESK